MLLILRGPCISYFGILYLLYLGISWLIMDIILRISCFHLGYYTYHTLEYQSYYISGFLLIILRDIMFIILWDINSITVLGYHAYHSLGFMNIILQEIILFNMYNKHKTEVWYYWYLDIILIRLRAYHTYHTLGFLLITLQDINLIILCDIIIIILWDIMLIILLIWYISWFRINHEYHTPGYHVYHTSDMIHIMVWDKPCLSYSGISCLSYFWYDTYALWYQSYHTPGYQANHTSAYLAYHTLVYHAYQTSGYPAFHTLGHHAYIWDIMIMRIKLWVNREYFTR